MTSRLPSSLMPVEITSQCRLPSIWLPRLILPSSCFSAARTGISNRRPQPTEASPVLDEFLSQNRCLLQASCSDFEAKTLASAINGSRPIGLQQCLELGHRVRPVVVPSDDLGHSLRLDSEPGILQDVFDSSSDDAHG